MTIFIISIMDDKKDTIRRNCWNKAIYCLGTSYIFQEKAKKYGKYLRWINVLGIMVPLLAGAIAMGYGQYSQYLQYFLIIAIPLSLAQVALSSLALIGKWGDSLSYALESQSENRKLAEEFRHLAENPPNDISVLEQEFRILNVRDDGRSRQDEKITFSNKEERKGMRYALKMLQLECAICKKVPIDMNPTNCDNCGKF